jgi:F-type H+-transporting ATPase subunit epsilon
MHLTITRINEPLFDGEAISVIVPGSDGVLTVLSHHEPFISILKSGKIRVKTTAEVKEFEIENGILEVSNNQATILL